jgi:hypothetical protein
MRKSTLSLAITSGLLASTSFAVPITTSYTENFDSMGTSGTTPPADWKHFLFNFGDNGTWSSTIPASGTNSVASTPVTVSGTTLTAVTTPTANNNNGYNAAASTSAPNDRVLATAPTTNAGTGIQLLLTNANSDAIDTLRISFDTVRYAAASSANQLPGYWLFISTDGTSWTNITPNPTITTVPNSPGVTPATMNFGVLSTPLVPAGGTFYLRWVDDNASQTSPDHIIGLNNVSIEATVVPEPATLSALTVLAGLTTLRRRR